jgi:signal transduction histidine kinase
MGGMRLASPGRGIVHPAGLRGSRELAFVSVILISDLFLGSNILDQRPTWWQRLLEASWIILGYAALRWRNSSPLMAFGIGLFYSVSGAVLTLLGVFDFTPFYVLLVTLFAVASERPLRVSSTALAATVASSALIIWYVVYDEALPGYQLPALVGNLTLYLPLSVMAWTAGRWSRSARDTVEHHRRRLAQASEAARDERLRIARELHDILAHTVTVMVLQAGGARRVLATDPATADDALGRIEEVGKTAMGELRRMLTLVRSPALTGDEPSQRGLADLGGLLDDALRAGVASRLEEHGSPVPLADSVDRTVYRIAQEAVTNIIKHAGPGTAATVRLTWEANLHIEIVDDGGGTPVMEPDALSTGNGLVGLAERVAVFGGAFTAGPQRRGFRVHASLPLTAPDSYVPWPRPEAEAGRP